MAVVSMKQLLEAGVHFGHQTRRWNPKMDEYIFTERNGIHIIDLQKTVKKIEESYAFIRDIALNGGEILFVGTKKQAQDAIEEEALRCGMFYVRSRWLGGMLTNYKTIKKRINRLKELYKMEENGTFDVLPKKEVIKLKLQMKKLETNLGGIKDMHGVPDALFVVDPKKERNAILEARKLNIPIVAIVDTNCDPDEADFVIPGNDDAIRAVKLIASVMANAVIEANQGEQVLPEEEKATEKPKVEEEIKAVKDTKVEEEVKAVKDTKTEEEVKVVKDVKVEEEVKAVKDVKVEEEVKAVKEKKVKKEVKKVEEVKTVTVKAEDKKETDKVSEEETIKEV